MRWPTPNDVVHDDPTAERVGIGPYTRIEVRDAGVIVSIEVVVFAAQAPEVRQGRHEWTPGRHAEDGSAYFSAGLAEVSERQTLGCGWGAGRSARLKNDL